MKYAIVEQNTVTNITLWDGVTPWTPPVGTEAVACPDNVGIGWTYDGSNWTEPEPPPPPPPPTEHGIASYRFLFELHTIPQQIQLDALKSAADALTPAQIGDLDPEAVDLNGYPLAVLRIVRLAYQQMERLGDTVDLLSHNMDVFLAAVASVGLYGQTSEEITAEIARIKANIPTS